MYIFAVTYLRFEWRWYQVEVAIFEGYVFWTVGECGLIGGFVLFIR